MHIPAQRESTRLRRYPTYKPAGIDWVGEIPAHWDVRRLRNIVDMRVSNVDKHIKDGELPVRLCNYVDVYKNERITDDTPFMQARFRLLVGFKGAMMRAWACMMGKGKALTVSIGWSP